MNYYYITGTSRGLGKAFVEELLNAKHNFVIGMSRKSSIEHPNYSHIHIDLADIDAVKNFRFNAHPDAEKIVLINNAGALSLVKPVGKLTSESIIHGYNLNLIAPGILTNTFINFYTKQKAEKIIVNISSGAAKNPVDGWSIYCASKAGLDMFSMVIAKEQKIQEQDNFRILSIAPGIVDTQMQAEIRNVKKEDFSRLDDFINYNTSHQLADPKSVAKKYFRILNNLDSVKETVISVRDFD